MTTKKLEKNRISEFRENICQDFYDACKDENNLMIGLEVERLPVYKKSCNAVEYFGGNGMYRLLRQIAYNDEWRYISDLTFINGLKKGNTTITLEPGGQIEYSLSPQKQLLDLKQELENLDYKVKSVTDILGISLLEYPISPLSDGKEIEIIPKRRYQTMAKFMNGERCFSMMRETAGIQVSVDYINESDAMRKYKISMMLAPFVTAMFANSPIRCGKITGYKSTRALSWLKTDESRCGLVSEKIFNHNQQFTFMDYVDAVLCIPVLFLQKQDKIIEVGGKINFINYLREGYFDNLATKEDYYLHSTLFFPEVRLKNIIEIRNQDTQVGELKYAIPALYKGILYSNIAMDEVFSLLRDISYEEYKKLREETPKFALNTKIKNKKILDYARIILDIAYRSLSKSNRGEEKYLEPIMQLVFDGLCPADNILREWNKSNRNIRKLVELVSIK